MIGTQWLKNKSSLCLKLPSVIVPNDYNFAINPYHDSFKNVKIVDKKDFHFDNRFFNKND